MRKILAATAMAIVSTSATANYLPPVPVVPKPIIVPHSGGGGGGAAGVGGFIAFVAVLSGYDAVRRWTCIGDPWRLGGPGFNQPMTVGNVKPPPQCGKRKRQVVIHNK